MNSRRSLVFALLTVAAGLSPLAAWDDEGHRIVNRLALAGLPEDFPAFVREAADTERIVFLASEPDRWRGNPDLPIKHVNGLDHYLDLEMLAAAGLTPQTVAPMRYVFASQYAAGRIVNPAAYAPIDPAKNSERSREWPGFAPWAIAEHYGKLKAAFSYLKTFEEHGGTAEEMANARANIVYVMGVMGHYVGDCAQPLHTTVHHNGWVGENPSGYNPRSGIHAWIDGGFIAKTGIGYADIADRMSPAQPLSLPAVPPGQDAFFSAVMDYIVEQHRQVEPLYALEKAGKFKDGPAGENAEGRALIEGQLLRGGQMLSAIWLTAWRTAPIDTYLRAQLLKRQADTAPAP